MDLIEQIVDDLYLKQNIGCNLEQKNLYSKKEYYELIKPVAEIIEKHKDLSVEEMRTILYDASNIEEIIKNMIYKKEIVPGIVCSYGTNNYEETIVIGNQQEISLNENGNFVEEIEPMTENTIFDLASVTKLFTSISILKLVQKGMISLEDEIVKYAPQFKNLKGVTIFDLISFRIPVKTNGRVDTAKDKEEAEYILFDMEVNDNFDGKRPYTDMGAMALKYVIEAVSGMNYYSFIEENILNPIQMKDTHVVIPNEKLNRVVNTNGNVKLYKDGNYDILTTSPKGIVYDEKARILGQPDGNLSGHAGLFSTAHDMTSLAKSIINNQILEEEYIKMMAKNRTGHSYIENEQQKYIQYLGFLCYSKNPILGDSEVFHAMGGSTFASAGWNGTQITVDSLNGVYSFIGTNKSHNRKADPTCMDQVKTDENGRNIVVLPTGEIKIASNRFAWEKDAIIHAMLKLTIQYKVLEELLCYTKKETQSQVKHLVKS